MLTENEYNNARTEFNNGNYNINYAIRNLTVLDEEEIRITDDFEGLQRDVWRRLWRPNLGEIEITKIENMLIHQRGTWGEWRNPIHQILTPYISNRELYDMNEVTWEHVFFADTYLEYVELETDS